MERWRMERVEGKDEGKHNEKDTEEEEVGKDKGAMSGKKMATTVKR